MSFAIVNLSGKIDGTVKFLQKANYVEVRVNLKGFRKNNPYAMHIHEFGDLSEGCMSCGGHFKKGNQIHGIKTKDAINIHAGDLINNIFPKNGKVNINFEAYGFNVNEIFGRSLMIHEQWDDMGEGGVYFNNEFLTYQDFANYHIKEFKKFYKLRYGSDVKDVQSMILKLDKETKITGNAGGRMACGIIGRMNSETEL